MDPQCFLLGLAAFWRKFSGHIHPEAEMHIYMFLRLVSEIHIQVLNVRFLIQILRSFITTNPISDFVFLQHELVHGEGGLIYDWQGIKERSCRNDVVH